VAIDRRHFLEISAAAITGLALSPAAESSSSPPSQSTPAARSSNTAAASSGFDLVSLTLAEAAAMIRRKQLSPVELIEASLARIALLDSKIGAFITVAAEEAREAARVAEKEIQQGKYRGPLHGIPLCLKDTNYTRGIRTTAASPVLRDFVPSFDATIVRRWKDAGAIIVGKANLPEFSFGGETPGTHNPWNFSRSPGGSSGGPAAALASSMVLGSSGGDTSGSIRNPAANCGVVGHKPTFGLVSRYGVIPISWTLDHVGPMARTVEDCAILLRAMAGYDPNDRSSARVAIPDYPELLKRNVRGMKLGVPSPALLEKFHPDSKRTFQDAVKVMEGLGVEIREVKMPPSLEVASASHTIIRIAEAAAYHRQFLLTRADRYLPDDESSPEVARVRTTVEAGSLLTAAQYLRAQQIRRVFIQELLETYAPLDGLLTPSMPGPPGEPANPPVTFRPEFNLCGFPAISVPAGFSTSPSGLPLGLLISGKPFDDRTVLALAYAYESATDWHRKRPDL
jgi:aspartyl-tRNA(Asn)/glutamyl-tRNA(Gln) amidotransferase subunit A